MPDDLRSAYAHVPVLTRENYPLWALKVKAYLAPNDHVRVIRREIVGNAEIDPAPPDKDNTDYDKWVKSEQMALGLIISTASNLHFEICHTFERGPAWSLWHAIKDSHMLQDANLWYEAWMALFTVRKTPTESYCDMYRHIEAAHSKIVRITPPDITPKQQFDEILLFTTLHALPPDDLLCRQLTSQGNTTLKDTYLTFLHMDRDITNASAIESANAAYIPHCHHCDEPGHLAKDCPYTDQFRQLVTRIKTGGNSNGSNCGSSHGRGKGCGSSHAATSTSDTQAAGGGRPPVVSIQQESAGVSTSLPLISGMANRWLADTGATCSMSHDHAAFLSLAPDWRPIHLADGKTVYSEGVDSICFQSSCGYIVTVNNVL